MRRVSSATSSCRNSTRSAEQRWPALSKAEASASSTTCSGSAEESTIMALRPPVSAISLTIGPSRAASARLMAMPVSVPPVKATPSTRGSLTSAAPTRLAPARQKMQHVGRNAGLMQQPHRAGRDQRRLLGGLGHHRVAGRQRAGDLAGENGERKVPGRDAREHAAPMQAERVLFSGRAFEQARGGEFQARLRRGIAQMIHRLAEIGLGIGERLARFPHQQRHQRRPVGLEQIGGAVEHGGPRLASPPVPIASVAALPLRAPCRWLRGWRSGTRRPPPAGHAAR